ncbi:Protein CWC15 A [Orchesella cincta]|uniref:Protein CWC15 A n=1 Tax=Orchesella cincta TaxID=48709 RepID=A0A1D2NJI9_ORCCI|nr:Protein CWC15 A [Orchesella cincta]
MTTAARPTFDPAKGGGGRGEKDLSALSRQYSSRDLPSHTKLKYREPGQGTTDEHKSKDFRREVEDRERQSRRDKEKEASRGRVAPEPASSSSSSAGAIQQPPAKKSKIDPANLDADDPIEDSDADDADEDSDDEDDTAALMAELQRIKKERAAEQAKKEAEKRAEEERIRAENILSGNPLLSYSGTASKGDMKVKRRWDEDVVFKNCARADDKSKTKGFINDCLRSDFHRKFMEKYIK